MKACYVEQELSLSVTDVNLVLVLPGSVFKPLPDALDYTVSWFKSGAGVPDPHSGILPSLVTVDITDFLSGPG